MGPMFSDTRSEVISGGNMFGAVGYLQCNPGQRVVPYNNWWWNMYSPLGSIRHKTGVVALETRQVSSTQEVPHSTSAGQPWPQFCGITKACCWCIIPTTEHNNDWTILRWSADKSASGSEEEAVGQLDQNPLDRPSMNRTSQNHYVSEPNRTKPNLDRSKSRKVCHLHLSLNHLLPPKRIFTNLRARASHHFQLPKYTTLLHKKSFIVRVLHKHVVLFGHWLDFVWDCDFL